MPASGFQLVSDLRVLIRAAGPVKAALHSCGNCLAGLRTHTATRHLGRVPLARSEHQCWPVVVAFWLAVALTSHGHGRSQPWPGTWLANGHLVDHLAGHSWFLLNFQPQRPNTGARWLLGSRPWAWVLGSLALGLEPGFDRPWMVGQLAQTTGLGLVSCEKVGQQFPRSWGWVQELWWTFCREADS